MFAESATENITKYPTIYLDHLSNRPNIWDIFKSSDYASTVRALYSSSAVVEYTSVVLHGLCRTASLKLMCHQQEGSSSR